MPAMHSALIVDDEPGIRHVFSCLLAMRGFRVHTAANGAEALEQVHTERPQLILLDNNMPIMGGLDFLRQLGDETRDIAVIFMSGMLDDETRAMALSLGACACLKKPIGVSDLDQHLARLTQARAA